MMIIVAGNALLYNRFYSVTGTFSLALRTRVFIGHQVTKPCELYRKQTLIQSLLLELTETSLTYTGASLL
jgi:hypothetical protein